MFQGQVEYEDVLICPSCGGKDKKLLFTSRDLRFYGPGYFPVVSCPECGLVRLARRPKQSSLGIYYPPDDYPAYVLHREVPSLKVQLRNLLLRAIFHLDYDKNVARSVFRDRDGRVLDIGCGAGHFLNECREMGWQTFGVEISDVASQRAMRLGHKVFHGVLEDAQFPDDYFDLIRARHVLEHLSDPIKAMLEMRRILKGHGTLIIEVPNASGLWARIFKQWYWQVDSPRHFFLFGHAVLLRAIERSGLKIKTEWTYSTLYGVDSSLHLVLGEIVKSIHWNHRLARTAQSIIRLLSVFPNAVVDRAAMGENIVVLAKKQ